MGKLIPIFVALAVCSISVKSDGDSKLLSFVQLFRHGARTPILFYKNDPYKDKSHWAGLEKGQLTEEGKLQLIELGQYIRKRYADFIPKNYNTEFFKMTSVTSQRNIDSAGKYLEGLYPEFNDTKNAVHVENLVLRTFLSPSYILQYTKLVATDKDIRSTINEHEQLFSYLHEKASFSVPIPERLLYAYLLYDDLSIEARNNLTLPDWTKSVFPESLSNMSKAFCKTMGYNHEMQKTATGPFLNTIINHFDRVLTKSTNQKVLLYSAHDINLMCLLNTFGIYEKFHYGVPDFASSMIFELREKDGKRFVNGYYKLNQDLHPITFRGCQFDCDYDAFKQRLSELRLDNREFLQMDLDTVSKSSLSREFSLENIFYEICQ